MRFEWDSFKDDANLKKHRVPFKVAITAFDDPWALVAADPKHSTDTESREWLIGESDGGRILVVVFTKRLHGQVNRIISARPANRRERSRYEELK